MKTKYFPLFFNPNFLSALNNCKSISNSQVPHTNQLLICKTWLFPHSHTSNSSKSLLSEEGWKSNFLVLRKIYFWGFFFFKLPISGKVQVLFLKISLIGCWFHTKHTGCINQFLVEVRCCRHKQKQPTHWRSYIIILLCTLPIPNFSGGELLLWSCELKDYFLETPILQKYFFKKLLLDK